MSIDDCYLVLVQIRDALRILIITEVFFQSWARLRQLGNKRK